jgi:hypothetical protein
MALESTQPLVKMVTRNLLCYICMYVFTTCIFTLRRSVALGRFRLRESVDAQTAGHSDTSDLAGFHIGFLVRIRNLANNDFGFVIVCPSVRVEQLGSHWTDFHEIWFLRTRRKPVEKIKI